MASAAQDRAALAAAVAGGGAAVAAAAWCRSSASDTAAAVVGAGALASAATFAGGSFIYRLFAARQHTAADGARAGHGGEFTPAAWVRRVPDVGLCAGAGVMYVLCGADRSDLTRAPLVVRQLAYSAVGAVVGHGGGHMLAGALRRLVPAAAKATHPPASGAAASEEAARPRNPHAPKDLKMRSLTHASMFVVPAWVDYLLPLAHVASVSTLCALWFAAVYSNQHFESVAHLRMTLLGLATVSGGATAALHRRRLQSQWHVADVAKAGHKPLAVVQGLHVAMLMPLATVEAIGVVTEYDIEEPGVLILSAAVVAAISMLTGKYMVVARHHELGSHVLDVQGGEVGAALATWSYDAEALQFPPDSSGGGGGGGGGGDPAGARESVGVGPAQGVAIEFGDGRAPWVPAAPDSTIWRRVLSGAPLHDSDVSDDSRDDSTSSSAASGRAVSPSVAQGAWRAGGIELQYWEAGTSSGGAPITHAFVEEVYLLRGDLVDTRLGARFEAGAFASRPPGMVHGPYTTSTGCVMLVVTRRA